MPAHTREVIRTTLRDAPATEIRFVEALTEDTHFFTAGFDGEILFVNPVHRALVESITGG